MKDLRAAQAPLKDPDEIEALKAKTERYCTVLQTLREPPPVEAA